MATRVGGSFVYVDFAVPYGAGIDAAAATSFKGLGLVVDAERGLAVVDRNTVPVLLGDVRVTVASAVELPARVVYVHPVHNVAVIQFDASAISAGTLRSIQFAATALNVGDAACFVGATDSMTMLVQDVVVTKHTQFFIQDSAWPRFRAHSEDVYSFDSVASCLGGVFVNADGELCALWASYSYNSSKGAPAETMKGLPASLIRDVVSPLLEQLRAPAPPPPPTPLAGDAGAAGCLAQALPTIALRSLEAELVVGKLSKARTAMRLSAEWAAKLEAPDVGADRRQTLYVCGVCHECCLSRARAGELFRR